MSLATQVLSYQVGAVMSRLAGSSKQKYHIFIHYSKNYYLTDVADGILPVEAKNTGEIILFFDELFDSLNGNTKIAPRGKPLKGGISRSSGHNDFYKNDAKKMREMYFVCKQIKKKCPCHPLKISLQLLITCDIYLNVY